MDSIRIILLAVCLSLTRLALLHGTEEDFALEKETSISIEALESLAELREKPLDINSASYDELMRIPYLCPVLCLRIIDYREKHAFGSIEDMLKIAGINALLLENIRPYITIRHKSLPPKRRTFSFRSLISGTLPRDTAYTSSPFALSQKAHYARGPFFCGVTAFRDPYERSIADFYALYAGAERDDITFIAGDYAMEIGERLISGYPGFVFKSSGAVKGRETMAKPYRSGFEDFAYRGAIFEKRCRMLDAALFLSMNRLDGTFEGDTAKRVIYETGYHRTRTELDKKNTIEERAAGATAAVGNESVRVRGTVFSARYDQFIMPEETHYFRFQGENYALSSLHMCYAGAHASVWSEYAHSHSTGGSAFIAGVRAHPEKLSMVMLYRDYGETYFSPRAFAFCETEVRNERGVYSFISASLPKRIRIAGYLDIFSRPYATYYTVFPINGYEAFLSLRAYAIAATVYLRYKYKEKNNYQWLDASLKAERQSIRCTITIPLKRKNTFRILLQAGTFRVRERALAEWGYVIHYSVKSAFFDIATSETGFVMFDTDSYNSRMYLSINDIPGMLHARPFYEQGYEGYLLLKAKGGQHLRLYGKFEIEKKQVFERRYRFGIEWK